MTKKRKPLSPLSLSLLHSLPSLLLLGLIAIGFVSLMYSEHQETVLGSQTSVPVINTEKVNERLQMLRELGKKIRSEEIEKEIELLSE